MTDEIPQTYNSSTDLALGNIPQIDDPVLYREFLDIHDAIENLLKGSDTNNSVFTAYIAKQRNVTEVTTDYTALTTDSLILADITAGNIIITLPTGAEFAGYRFEVKAVADTLPSIFQCLIVGEDIGVGAAPIDDDIGGITIDALEAVPFKYDLASNKYWIHN